MSQEKDNSVSNTHNTHGYFTSPCKRNMITDNFGTYGPKVILQLKDKTHNEKEDSNAFINFVNL